MNSKRKKEIIDDIEDALHHEENLQNDDNEKPITFVKKIERHEDI
ncbi:hypothetical protein [Nitrosopumilus sp.]|nr:hypothetical protein [Nitrosopumilus sp.]